MQFLLKLSSKDYFLVLFIEAYSHLCLIFLSLFLWGPTIIRFSNHKFTISSQLLILPVITPTLISMRQLFLHYRITK